MTEEKEEKKRLDLYLVERELFPTRSRARAEIMAGNVFVDGKKRDKPGTIISTLSKVEIQKAKNPYVSRGGLKLQKALEQFNINVEEKIVLDIGASTGGFTHCLLKYGAARVYALDVGYGQLAWELRNHPQVVTMERFNVRYLKRENLHEQPHLATIDVSFISLEKVLPVVASLEINEVICLIKPQFEAAPSLVGKKGVVKDRKVHEDVITRIIELSLDLSYSIAGLTYSPLKGPSGNIEYLLYLSKNDGGKEGTKKDPDINELIKVIVSSAHALFLQR